jgi:hypothetical protein
MALNMLAIVSIPTSPNTKCDKRVRSIDKKRPARLALVFSFCQLIGPRLAEDAETQQ